jgi:phage terminase small subunit
MAKPPGKRIAIRPSLKDGESGHLNNHWRRLFLDHLAESSNVTASAEKAGISASRAYKVRREEPQFARQWLVALAEGYLHLEMDVVRRLREGDARTADDGKFDFANAIRLLAAHRNTAARSASETQDVSAAEVRASIDRKIEDIRKRIARQKAAAEAKRA